MSARCAGIARASGAIRFAGDTSVLLALRRAGVTGCLITLRLAGSALGLAGLTGRAGSTLRLACVARGLVALRLAGLASHAGVAGSAAIGVAGMAASSAGALATDASRAGLGVARTLAAAFGGAGGVAAGSFAGQLGGNDAGASELDVEVKVILAGVMRTGDSLGTGDLSSLLDEYAGASQASERRPFRRELLTMDDVVFTDLDMATHVQCEIEQPVAFFGTAAQQAHVTGQTRGCLTAAALQTGKDAFFLQGSRRVAALFWICHCALQCRTVAD